MPSRASKVVSSDVGIVHSIRCRKVQDVLGTMYEQINFLTSRQDEMLGALAAFAQDADAPADAPQNTEQVRIPSYDRPTHVASCTGPKKCKLHLKHRCAGVWATSVTSRIAHALMT